ncbi:MAG: TonB-dependent receptor [Gracilimonas sp.]|uniref:TonB-dependent receptor family protein n=1 Tax=Gracilimonas sp. TaxID=1974203 RepID=UPI0037514E0D|nr:TonB-dependent receptor [Gracilimonas sp.]
MRKITLLITAIFLSTSYLAAQQTAKDSVATYDKVIYKRINVVGAPAWIEKTPGSATYIGTRELQKFEYNDINRILRSVTGVNIQEEDGFGLRPNIGLRGTGVSRSAKITLMEDGILAAPAPYAAPAAYYFPSVGRMSAIEVRKGSSQIKYGPFTTGGALNLISTRIPYDLTGNAQVSAGELSTRNIHANIGNTYKNFGFLVETYQQENDGFKALDNGGNTGFDIKDFIGKFMIKTNPTADVFQKVEFKIGYYEEMSNETYLGLTESDFQENPYRRYTGSQVDLMDVDHQQYSVRHFAQFSENLDITTTLYKNDFNRNWYKLDEVDGVSIGNLLAAPQANQSAYNIVTGQVNSADDALAVKANNRSYYSQGIQSIIGSNLKVGTFENSIELGIRYHYDEMDRFQWVDGYRMEGGQMIRTSIGTPGTDSNRIESANALALYIQNKILINSKLTITPGLRYENITLKRENWGTTDPDRSTTPAVNEINLDVFVPGLGANYNLSKTVNIFGGVHKGFAPPGSGASPDTDPEKSINYELGSRFNSERIYLEVVGFFNDYSNLLGSDLAAGGGTGSTDQFNAGEVNTTGLEVSSQLMLTEVASNFQLPLSLNYTYTNAEFQNSFDSSFGPWGDIEKGDELPYLPKHQLNASLGIYFNKIEANISFSTSSKMRTIAGQGSISNNESTDAYLLTDLNLGYRINEYAKVFMDIKNLTDETYIVARRPAGLRPGLPRYVLGGIQLSF